MSSPLPPLNALRAFEVAARHLSFSRAADELHVTPAALSHQIKGLEDFLQVKLFHRRTRSIELTDAGRTLYPGLHDGFGHLRQAVASLDRIRDDRVLVISAPPGFTAKWLTPRLYRFLEQSPDIDARISATPTMADFAADGVDVSIRNMTQTENLPEMVCDKLVDICLLPVVSPRYLENHGPLQDPGDLRHVNLIFDRSLPNIYDLPSWADWLAEAGVEGVDLGRGLSFNSADHALEAAIEGAGVLLSHYTLAHDDLRTGRLVAPFPLKLKTRRAFHFVCPQGSEIRPKIAAFRSWLHEEVAMMEAKSVLSGCQVTEARSSRPAREPAYSK
ncbi:MAG: transcriptional regulator GcvA [Hyphomicrobiaceae bacterium]